ncbi:MAG: PCRF domain-containing protein, partial [Clostridia bacterium]|nr:PCRF domain-containing protein [Clostridia bacterium]
MIKIDDYKAKTKSLKILLEETGDAIMLTDVRKKLDETRAELEKPEVWGDLALSQKLSKEASECENKINFYEKADKSLNDCLELLEMLEVEEDESILAELDGELQKTEESIENMRLAALLKGKYDNLNAILTLHAGAGGTEACDWTEMLYRM